MSCCFSICSEVTGSKQSQIGLWGEECNDPLASLIKTTFWIFVFLVIRCEAGTKDKGHFSIKLQCRGHVFAVGKLMTS